MRKTAQVSTNAGIRQADAREFVAEPHSAQVGHRAKFGCSKEEACTYIASIAQDLQQLARRQDLDFVAYLLRLAICEARTGTHPNG